MKGCVISAAMTGAGKTTLTLGLLSAFRNRGMAVQPFKIGPDFIDTGLHGMASGVPSHNLDGWMLTRETNERLYEEAAPAKRLRSSKESWGCMTVPMESRNGEAPRKWRNGWVFPLSWLSMLMAWPEARQL
jgi:hypothetical protein